MKLCPRCNINQLESNYAKRCTACRELAITEEAERRRQYYKNYYLSTNLSPEQKQARAEAVKAHRQTDKFKSRQPIRMRTRNLLTNYGLTLKDYDQMVSSQEGKCLICGCKPDKLHIDHCHATNEVRGLLCINCNMGLGQFKDCIEYLQKAIEYLSVKSR